MEDNMTTKHDPNNDLCACDGCVANELKLRGQLDEGMAEFDKFLNDVPNEHDNKHEQDDNRIIIAHLAIREYELQQQLRKPSIDGGYKAYLQQQLNEVSALLMRLKAARPLNV